MVLEESTKVSRYGSGVLGAVRRCQLWLFELPEGCQGSQRQGGCAIGEYTLKENKMGEKAMQKAVACCFWSSMPCKGAGDVDLLS